MTRLLISALVCTGCFLFFILAPLWSIRCWTYLLGAVLSVRSARTGLVRGTALFLRSRSFWRHGVDGRFVYALFQRVLAVTVWTSSFHGVSDSRTRDCGAFRFWMVWASVYGIGGLVLWRQKKLGLADVLLLFGLAFGLGFERMQVCMAISLLTGFVLLGFSNEDIPFGSALMIGFSDRLCARYDSV